MIVQLALEKWFLSERETEDRKGKGRGLLRSGEDSKRHDFLFLILDNWIFISVGQGSKD